MDASVATRAERNESRDWGDGDSKYVVRFFEDGRSVGRSGGGEPGFGECRRAGDGVPPGGTGPGDAASIAVRTCNDYRRFELVRRVQDGDESKHGTITRFDSWEAVEAFGGENPEEASVSPKTRELLTDYDESVEHYEARDGETV